MNIIILNKFHKLIDIIHNINLMQLVKVEVFISHIVVIL